MNQLFVTDLDGTLLNPQGKISPESAEIITRLTNQGVMISVATARTPATVEPLMKDTLTSVPAIVLTGAAMWDRKTHRFLYPKFFPHELALAGWKCFINNGLRPFVFSIPDDGERIHAHFSGMPNAIEQQFIDERKGTPYKTITISPEPQEPDGRAVLIFAMGPHDATHAAAEELRGIGIDACPYPDVYNEGNYVLEVFAPGVSKAAAVKQLKEMTGADYVTGFGDNLNDLPMMEVADRAVAVANAMPQVKEAADVVIGPNTDNSVARYIQENC